MIKIERDHRIRREQKSFRKKRALSGVTRYGGVNPERY